VALQTAGVIAAAAQENKSAPGSATPAGQTGHDGSSVAASEAHANLKRDTQKAAAAGNGRHAPVERVLEQPETRVSEEGTNLLAQHQAE
jgi:hypothetical protein